MVWQEAGGVFIRKLDAQGNPVAEPYAVSVEGTAFAQPAIASNGTGGLVTWGLEGNEALFGLFAQRFTP
ncbi:hypothetical protein D3C72_2408110 [compost metagenome]